MDIQIAHYEEQHLEGVVRLSLRAWAPVSVSLQELMDPELYQAFFPDWCVHQQVAVEHVCHSEDYHVRVALSAGSLVGFVAVKLRREDDQHHGAPPDYPAWLAQHTSDNQLDTNQQPQADDHQRDGRDPS